MKSIKILGLMALVALTAMAFVGAGSAMAEQTTLCKEELEGEVSAPCGKSAVTSVHEESVGKAKLLASPEVQCNVLFSSTSVGGEAAPQIIKGHFTYTNCGCSVEEEPGTTAEIKVLRLGHETADVTGSAKIIVECFGIECTYNGTGLVGTAKGPLLSSKTNTNGEVVLNEQEVKGGGFFCPSKGKLDITTVPLVKTYITGGLHYCIELDHPNGLYQASCATLGAGKYELVVSLSGPLALTTRVCNDQRRSQGLWIAQNCTSDEPSDLARFEKGEVVVVE